MKKYFAKYLPVEGEIKEDDYALNPSNGKVVRVNAACLKHLVTSEWKKVKLFLCSRDIQVGDKVKYYNISKTEIFEDIIKERKVDVNLGEVVTFNNETYLFINEAFKVIGEISPDAIWVKEGDEFDEEDLEPVLFYSKHPDESMYMDIISNLEEWKKLNPDNKKNRYVPMIEIKCPTCKTFH